MYIQNIPKYVIKKYFQIVFLMSKLDLNYFYAYFKQWLQEVKNPYTYFSPIKLIPNFYDMYIMYSQSHFIKIYFIYFLLLFTIKSSKQLQLLLVYVSMTTPTCRWI